MVSTSARRIERVPPLLVALLNTSGTLPAPPAAVTALWRRENQRLATLEETAALTWVIEFQGPAVVPGAFGKPLGVVGFVDRFDLHTNSDVRHIEYLAGTPRSCVTIVRHLGREAKLERRRLVAAIDLENMALAKLLSSMGYTPKRVMFEDV